MFTVVTAADETALTTLDAVRLELKIVDKSDDDWLESQINIATDLICEYYGVPRAEDGTRTLGRQTVTETFDRSHAAHRRNEPLVLALRPVSAVSEVSENGIDVDASDYRLNGTTGKLERLSAGLIASWPRTLITVTYTAGWLMPGQSGRTLPTNIEQAAIQFVKEQKFSRTRDPDIKSENIPGVRQVDYFFGSPGSPGLLPPSVLVCLGDRNLRV